MKELNINSNILVRLTEYGEKILDAYQSEIDESNKKNEYDASVIHAPKADKDGLRKFQLWHFMSIFGEHCKLNGEMIIEDNIIYIYKGCIKDKAINQDEADKAKNIMDSIIKKLDD